MSDNLKTWLAVCRPPETALKNIGGGRLKGMTDINPQWRYKAMTEQFGLVGIGWKYRVTERWERSDAAGQVAVFVSVALQVKIDGQWSDDISGTGGAMLITEESKKDFDTGDRVKVLYFSDEAYKMAETDALSVAMKQLGVAGDIYMGLFNGSKYTRPIGDEPDRPISQQQLDDLNAALDSVEANKEAFCKVLGISSLAEITVGNLDNAKTMVEHKRKAMEKANAK